VQGNRSQSEALGSELAEKLKAQGAGEILAKIFAEVGRG
jgi:hydroxymethylbilane synthase